jgi:hypothetical protein
MAVDRGWLRAEAARLGLALTDDDLGAIAQLVEKTRTELAAVPQAPSGAQDPTVGFLPLDEDASAESGTA